MSEREILKEIVKILLDVITFIYRQYKKFLNPEDKVLLESKIILLSKLYKELNEN